MIGQLYDDIVNVYRKTSKDDGYGGTVEEELLVHTGIPCRLSQKTMQVTTDDNKRSSVQSFKLFFAVGKDIRQNDRLEVFRKKKLNDKYTFLAGRPLNYYELIPHAESVLAEVQENED